MTEKIYDYLDFYKVDLIALGITQNDFLEWLNNNNLTELAYFSHPQIAGLVYFVEENHAMACKLIGNKYDESII